MNVANVVTGIIISITIKTMMIITRSLSTARQSGILNQRYFGIPTGLASLLEMVTTTRYRNKEL